MALGLCLYSTYFRGYNTIQTTYTYNRNPHLFGTQYYFLANGYKVWLGINPMTVKGYLSFVVLNYTSFNACENTPIMVACVCVCVCVFFSSHSFRTSSSLDVPAGVTQEEGHTGFFIHLPSAVRAFIFLARRIQPFLSLVDREVEFCVLTI